MRQRQSDPSGRLRCLHRMRHEPGMQLNRVVAAKSAVADLIGRSEAIVTYGRERHGLNRPKLIRCPGLIGHVRAHGYNAWPALF